VLVAKEDYTGSEPLYRRALAIDEKALGRTTQTPPQPEQLGYVTDAKGTMRERNRCTVAPSL